MRLVSAILLLLPVYVSAETLYISPNASSCPEPVSGSDVANTTCATLSQFATQSDADFAESMTLNVLPGVHVLDSDLSISNQSSFELLANASSEFDTIIACHNDSTKFLFTHIHALSIGNIVFAGCVGNVVQSVELFTLENSTFRSRGGCGPALLVLDTNQVQIARNVFDSFTANGTEDIGGVFNIYSSSVSIVYSTFTNNKAYVGGVMSVVRNSSVNIDSSDFCSNEALLSGGVLYVQDSLVMVTSSEFSNNSAQALGGVTYANTSTVSFSNTVFVGNEAFRGGVVFADESAVYFQDSNITESYANRGSVAYANYSTVVGVDSLFAENEASRGAVVYATHGVATFTNCRCMQNIAGRGGVCYLFNSTVVFDNSTSFNNTASRGGAIYAFYYCSAFISNSALSGNRATRIGGLMFVVSNSVIRIENSIISNNEVEINSVLYVVEQSTLFISMSSFTNNTSGQIGGILSVEFVMVHINESSFTNNSSPIGAMSIARSSMITEGRCIFTNNLGSLIILNSNVSFTEATEFYGNTHKNAFIEGRSNTVPELGGAITCILSDVVFSGSTSFQHNRAEHGGAIVALQSRIYVYNVFSVFNNTGVSTGGGIYASLSSLKFRGTSMIISNNAGDKGGGIHSLSASVELFSGTLVISNNRARFGGGVFLEQSGKLYVVKEQYEYPQGNVQEHLRLEFSANTADIGGAIHVADNSTSSTCASNSDESLSNECFLQTLQAHTNLRANNSLNLLSMFFSNNHAKESGATIFGGLLDRCTPSSNAEAVVNNLLSNPDALTYLSAITDISNFSTIASEPLRVCFCRESENLTMPDCNYSPQNISVMKGGRLTILAAAVDEINNTIPATIVSTLSSQTSGLNEGQLLQQTGYTCTPLEYNIASPDNDIDLLLFAIGPCRDLGKSRQSINIRFEPCKCGIGFQITSSLSRCECVCDVKLGPYITDCHSNTLSRDSNFWIGFVDVNKHKCVVLQPNCPYDYCIAPNIAENEGGINLNNPDGADSQCGFNRTGLLCGSCKDNLSLSLGSSRCVKCSNSWIALLIPFALFGVLLVSIVLLLNLTVAVGTINGLIFYSNVVIANRAIFLPFSQPAAYFFISWLNLDWGFETCFFDGMDAYSKIWLQFAFPFYIFFLVTLVIIISEKSQRFSKILASRNPVAALSTLILLSYTKLLRNIITVLSYADLKCIDGSESQRVWLLDANVRYLEGKHIPLFIAALIVVVFGLAYTSLLLFGQWLPLLPKWKVLKWIKSTKFHAFLEAYHAPFHPKHRYWVGLLLLVRVFLYLTSAYNTTGNPYIGLYPVMFTICCLFVFKDVLRSSIYKSWPLGALETGFLFNLLIFTGATLYVKDSQGSQNALAYTSLYITFAILVGVLFYHTYVQFLVKTRCHKIIVGGWRKVKDSKPNLWRRTTEQVEGEKVVMEEINLDVCLSNDRPEVVTERYREPLLEDEQYSNSGADVIVGDNSTSAVTHTEIDGIAEENSVPLSAALDQTL